MGYSRWVLMEMVLHLRTFLKGCGCDSLIIFPHPFELQCVVISFTLKSSKFVLPPLVSALDFHPRDLPCQGEFLDVQNVFSNIDGLG